MSGDVIDLDRWRDFNDAEPQRLDDTRPWDGAESTEDIKARMLANIRGVLS